MTAKEYIQENQLYKKIDDNGELQANMFDIETWMQNYHDAEVKKYLHANMEEKIIEFAIYLTGHDRETIEQMYLDWQNNLQL